MAKARHPHNSKRPTSARVKKALEDGTREKIELSLTPRQRSFAYEYVVDFQGSAAAIRAGYSKNFSDRAAHLLLKHEGVSALIQILNQSKEARLTSIDPDYVISEVTRIIQKADAKDGDKLGGLELLARHLGMFIDRTEISGPDGGAIKTEEVQREADDFVNQINRIAKRPSLKVVE